MRSDASALEANRSIPRRLAANLQHKSGKAVINGSMIFRQVYHDLFGSKDAQDASTLTYTWVADQFGHITLGFIVTLLLDVVLSVEWSAILVAVLITVKEAYDYFCELDRRQDAFPFDSTDMLLNCATSCIYTWIGAALAVVAVRIPFLSLLAAPVLLVVSLPIAAYWLRRKVALQQSDVPFLYRLANFPENFADRDGPGIITSLVAPAAPEFRHVVLTGPLDSGKTSLAVGTATEFGYRVGLCRFISLVKLAQTGFSPEPGMTERRGLHVGTTFQDGRTIWPLGAVDFLIVDDADGGVPELGIDPSEIKQALLAQLGNEFFSLMRERRTLWVAGTNDCAEKWHELVAALLTDNDLARVGKVALRDDLQSTLRAGRLARTLASFSQGSSTPLISRRKARAARAGAGAKSTMAGSSVSFDEYKAALKNAAAIFARLTTWEAIRTFPSQSIAAISIVIGVYVGRYLQIIKMALADERSASIPLGLPQSVFTDLVIGFAILFSILVLGLFYVGYLRKPKNQGAANAVSHLVTFLSGALLGIRGG